MSNKFLKAYFFYSEREKSGIQVLLFLIVFLIVVLYFKREAEPITIIIDEDQKKPKVEATLASYQEKESKPEVKMVELFMFDPNGLSLENWQKLGLSKKQAAVIKRYESKGGSLEVN